jgi:hypothetical protein
VASDQQHGGDFVSAIDYFHLVSEQEGGWEPLLVERLAGRNLSFDGQPLGPSARLQAAFTNSVWRSTRIDPAFGLIGLRLGPHLAMPQRHHNLRQLTIVFGGELLVDDSAGNARIVCVGQFFVTEADTPYTLTAGPDGATFTETWPPKFAAELETYWYLDLPR